MQIHELTQPRKSTKVDEGLVSGASDLASRAAYKLGGAKRGLAGIKAAWQQGQVATQARKLANQSQDAWDRYVQNWEATLEPDEKAKFIARQDGGLYKRQLTAWVQKHMLSGMTLSNVTNRGEILSIIDALSAPKQLSPVKEADDKSPGGIVIPTGAKTASTPSKAAPTQPPSTPGLTPKEEQRLWLKLAQEVGRAQIAAYTGEKEAQAQAQAQSDASADNTQTTAAPQADMTADIQQALTQAGQTKNLGAIASLVQQLAQTSSVKSTGNVAVDSLLRNMGFTVS